MEKEEINKSMEGKIKEFLKWAFSPINSSHTYRGVTIRNPYPNFLLPIVLPLMLIAALPILIVYAPFWLFFKITDLFHNKKTN